MRFQFENQYSSFGNKRGLWIAPDSSGARYENAPVERGLFSTVSPSPASVTFDLPLVTPPPRSAAADVGGADDNLSLRRGHTKSPPAIYRIGQARMDEGAPAAEFVLHGADEAAGAGISFACVLSAAVSGLAAVGWMTWRWSRHCLRLQAIVTRWRGAQTRHTSQLHTSR